MGFFSDLLGLVTVTEEKNSIRLGGFRADQLVESIDSQWGTTRVSNSLFTRKTRSYVEFPTFFAYDVLYMLKTMRDRPKDNRVARSFNRRLGGQLIDGLLKNTWLKNTIAEQPSRMDMSLIHKTMNVTPLEHQLPFFSEYDSMTQKNGLVGALVAAAAGSGKTILSLMAMIALKKTKVIIVAPNNSLDRVWKATLDNNFKRVPKYWISNTTNSLVGNEEYIVVNYEYLDKLIAKVKHVKGNIGIILDECHNFNSRDSLRVQSFLELCSVTNSTDTLWMSGTPIKALPVEAIPLLRSIVPMFTPSVEERFRGMFGTTTQRANDILENRLKSLSFRVEKSELKLAPPIMRTIPIKLADGDDFTLEKIAERMKQFVTERLAYYAARKDQDYGIYEKCIAQWVAKLHGGVTNPLYKEYRGLVTAIQRANGDSRIVAEEMKRANKIEKDDIIPAIHQQLVKDFRDVKSVVKYVRLKIQGECLGRIVGGARIDAHVRMCKHVDYKGILNSTQKKTVVFTSYVPVIDELKVYLPSLKLTPAYVFADTTKDLAKIVDEFGKDEKINPLVATFASLSTAVPLVMADVAIMVDAPFRDYILQQSIARISRIGATTQTYVYQCVLETGEKPNISTRSVDILAWSQTQIEQITGVRSPYAPGANSIATEDNGELSMVDICLEDYNELSSFEDDYISEEKPALEGFMCW